MDPIDKAISAAQPKAYQATQLQHSLASGRKVMVTLPADFTDRELHEAIGWLQVEGWATFVGAREQAHGRIVLASGPLPGG